MERSPYYEKIAVKKGSWTPEEDRKLTAYVTKYGCWNWCQIPKYAGLARCGKSCRLRWMNYLRPNIKRGNYRIEEDEMIIKLHKLLGNKWSAIAANLPGRTDNDIKNHWHTSLNKRSKEISIPDEPLPGRNGKRSTSEKDQNLSSNLESDDISKSSSLKKRPKEISIPDEPLPGRLKKDQNSSSNLENVDILKSSKNPPQPASNQFSTSTIETDATNCAINVAAECAEITAEDGGDFWTQPFLLEGSTNDIHAPLVESELQYSYFSTNGGGFVYSTGVDLFTW